MGGPLKAPPEGPPEVPQEDPAEGAAGGQNYAFWLHFSRKKVIMTERPSVALVYICTRENEETETVTDRVVRIYRRPRNKHAWKNTRQSQA